MRQNSFGQSIQYYREEPRRFAQSASTSSYQEPAFAVPAQIRKISVRTSTGVTRPPLLRSLQHSGARPGETPSEFPPIKDSDRRLGGLDSTTRVIVAARALDLLALPRPTFSPSRCLVSPPLNAL